MALEPRGAVSRAARDRSWIARAAVAFASWVLRRSWRRGGGRARPGGEQRRHPGDAVRACVTLEHLRATIRGAIPVAEERRNCDDHYGYSPAQAARVLRVTPTRVRQLLQSGELEGERDAAGHWSIPARAVVERLDRLHRERSLEAAVCDTSSIREAQERVEALQRELGRLEGRLESGEKARRYLEADRILLAQRLERERLR